jgi:hypothetical protein
MAKMIKNGKKFIINSKRSFEPKSIEFDLLEQAFNFSIEMVFGSGANKETRSGGNHKRKKVELFVNTFQGKIAEFIFRKLLINNDFKNVSDVDVNVYGRGKWDDTDLVCNGFNFSIKSGAFFSNLLLLETDDWNKNAEYIHNTTIGGTNKFDYFVFVRIKPDLKGKLLRKKMLYNDKINLENLKELIFDEVWYYDIGGICTDKTIKYIIKNNYVINKGDILGGTTPMDASNYYIQCGDMKDFNFFIEKEKEKINKKNFVF